MPYAIPYTALIAIGLPFLTFTHGACTYMRADGSPTYSMVVQIIGSVFNLLFDPFFLFVCNMGIFGIALATTLSQILTAAISAHYLIRKRRLMSFGKKDMLPTTNCFKPISAIGFGVCINQIAGAAALIVLNDVLRHYGARLYDRVKQVYKVSLSLSSFFRL